MASSRYRFYKLIKNGQIAQAL